VACRYISEHLLKPLQQVSGPLGGRPTLPILGNLLLQVAEGTLSLTGTDLEMEMVARVTRNNLIIVLVASN
jgi:DNA polymerase-3 subunit beta